jgi:predicted peroxiredoxin
MSEQKKIVIINSRGLDDERSSVAWSVANTAASSGMDVTIFLVSSGVDWARRGAADAAQLNPLDPKMSDMIDNVVSSGGRLLVCPPCAKVRGYSDDCFIEGTVLAGAPALLEKITEGAYSLSF